APGAGLPDLPDRGRGALAGPLRGPSDAAQQPPGVAPHWSPGGAMPGARWRCAPSPTVHNAGPFTAPGRPLVAPTAPPGAGRARGRGRVARVRGAVLYPWTARLG